MKDFIKKYLKIILIFAIVGLIGGFFTGLYAYDSYPEEIKQQIAEQGMDKNMIAVIAAVQSALYGAVLGSIGIVLSKKAGLWKDKVQIEKKPIIASAVVSLVCGSVMIISDILFFSKYSQVIADSYLVKPSAAYIIASVTYGAVIEEVMLRLFMMSLTAVILHIVFERKKEKVSDMVLIISNIVCAVLFAAGHLPMTVMSIGSAPMIIFRCFLLNGGIGLAFGWLYRKYGFAYSVIAHGGCHVVSKLIWVVFL